MKASLLLTVASFVFVGCKVSDTTSGGERWVSYEPEEVELTGTLTTEVRYRPPMYGEDPTTDKEVRPLMLVLSEPVSVREIPGDELFRSFRNVRKMHLVFVDHDPLAYDHLIGKSVVVVGTLFPGHTGHHHTEVLIDAKSIRER
jgi:hypothetical protein